MVDASSIYLGFGEFIGIVRRTQPAEASKMQLHVVLRFFHGTYGMRYAYAVLIVTESVTHLTCILKAIVVMEVPICHHRREARVALDRECMPMAIRRPGTASKE
jgi:hypothetical protein